MTGNASSWLIVLAAGAVYIWLHDLTWWDSQPLILLLILVPLIPVCLCRPWRLRSAPLPLSRRHQLLLAAAALSWLAGLGTGFVFPFALSWTAIYYIAMYQNLTSARANDVLKLLPFALLAFPWIVLDGDGIGWYFRLSGAIVNEHVLAAIGLDVERQGVSLIVSGLAINVLAECDGIDTLQAMLMAGGVLGFLILGNRDSQYWYIWPMIIIFAWLANTLRILLISIVGLLYGADFAMGTFHDWGGTITVSLMFLLFAFLSLGMSLRKGHENEQAH
jgi:exosortase